MAKDPPIDLIEKADALGIRLEIIGGLPVWEAAPLLKHQKAVDRIRASIRAGADGGRCGCFHYADVAIVFEDGSLKRPDVAIFCTEPKEDDEAIRQIPEAVVEVISRGYEAKDLELAPRFYLSQGVQDVIVLDPHTLVVLHVRRDSAQRLISPAEINLECGCVCVV